ncbi:MAG: hypothetical protein CFE23_15995 [Flavobacterium sp. BFFFF1]|uniref:hypothetical protein n=1 Tax=Flavobacterium sp. BFFFF1 TaxID=2015557 RepID=UPI000BD67547|nr:hypothetical protein [Flavobacterium sp. BFFFF1]OYU79012.1 MAG: hypothetical protein CFE23_15995 [Flavobacterium sp. BFFFF1]
MITPKIGIAAFALLTIITFPLKLIFYNSDIASSVIPGWHTTIFPPYLVAGIIVSFFVFINFIGYCIISKRKTDISLKLFLLHLVLILPAIFITDLIDPIEHKTNLALIISIAAILLFIASQVSFGIMVFKKGFR